MTGIIDETVKIRKQIQAIVLSNPSEKLSYKLIIAQLAGTDQAEMPKSTLCGHLRDMGISIKKLKYSKELLLILDVLKETKGKVSNDEIHTRLIDNGYTDVPKPTLIVWVKRVREEYQIMSGQIAVKWEKEAIITALTETLAELKEQGNVKPKPGVLLRYLAKHKNTYISRYTLKQATDEMDKRKLNSNKEIAGSGSVFNATKVQGFSDRCSHSSPRGVDSQTE